MKEAVNATRMELTRLKNRLATTRRGHHLLKDKQDEMMRQFLAQIEAYKKLRSEVEKKWLKALATFSYVKLHHYKEELLEKFIVPSVKLAIDYDKTTVMNVAVPKITVREATEPALTYSFLGTNPPLDDVVFMMARLFPMLVRLAEEDKKNRVLIKEIEKTKRRVNAIEHLIIPEIVEDIKMVRMKISDAERSNTVRIMKSKDLILKKKIQQ